MASALNERQKGALPSQPLPNPNNSFLVNEAEEVTPKQYNTVHILRSRKQVDNQVSNATVSNHPLTAQPDSNDSSSSTSSQPSTSKSDEKDKSAEQTYKPIVLFPNRLANTKTNVQMKKIEKNV